MIFYIPSIYLRVVKLRLLKGGIRPRNKVFRINTALLLVAKADGILYREGTRSSWTPLWWRSRGWTRQCPSSGRRISSSRYRYSTTVFRTQNIFLRIQIFRSERVFLWQWSRVILIKGGLFGFFLYGSHLILYGIRNLGSVPKFKESRPPNCLVLCITVIFLLIFATYFTYPSKIGHYG